MSQGPLKWTEIGATTPSFFYFKETTTRATRLLTANGWSQRGNSGAKKPQVHNLAHSLGGNQAFYMIFVSDIISVYAFCLGLMYIVHCTVCVETTLKS